MTQRERYLFYHVEHAITERAWVQKEKRALDVETNSSFWAHMVGVLVTHEGEEFSVGASLSEREWNRRGRKHEKPEFSFALDASDAEVGATVLRALETAS